jgi:hypothetical protein
MEQEASQGGGSKDGGSGGGFGPGAGGFDGGSASPHMWHGGPALGSFDFHHGRHDRSSQQGERGRGATSWAVLEPER